MSVTIVLGPVGEVRGRLNDQDGRPIAGAEVMPVSFSRPAEDHPGQDLLRLSPELAGPLRTTTAADGSFAIEGIPPGCQVHATIAAPGFGKPRISWDATRPVTIVLDGRLGRIEGRLKPPDDARLSGKLSVSLRRKISREDRASAPFQVFYSQTVTADQDGASGSTTCRRAATRSSPSSAAIPAREPRWPRRSRSARTPSPGSRSRSSGT